MSSNGQPTESLMTPEQFGAYIEKRLTLHADDITLIYREGMAMRLDVRGEPTETDLSSFYEAYRANPSQIDAVMQTLIHVLIGDVPQRAETEFNALADRIFPMLKKIDLLAVVSERKLPMLVYREFLADLIVTYVVHETNSVSYINEQHLDTWEVNATDLHELALENLRSRTLKSVDYATVGQGDQRLFIFNSGDGYDATRLLLTDVLAGWARELSGTMIIGVPHRDLLVALGDADDEVLRNVAHQIQADSAQQHGLTDQLFTLQGGQIREYEW